MAVSTQWKLVENIGDIPPTNPLPVTWGSTVVAGQPVVGSKTDGYFDHLADDAVLVAGVALTGGTVGTAGQLMPFLPGQIWEVPFINTHSSAVSIVVGTLYGVEETSSVIYGNAHETSSTLLTALESHADVAAGSAEVVRIKCIVTATKTMACGAAYNT
jgi:hypothetical protein